MIFCINIEGVHKTICYRLQKDKTWQPCLDKKVISPNDFFTSDRQVVLDIQLDDRKITINDDIYLVSPTDGNDFLSDKVLFYFVYGFRKEFPSYPVRRQLEATLINGNDSRNNSLILKIDGNFYLIDTKKINFSIVDPEIVYQFDGFKAGKGCVGLNIIDNNNFDKNVEELFITGMYYWKNHIINKNLHEQSEFYESVAMDDLLSIYSELGKIKLRYNETNYR